MKQLQRSILGAFCLVAGFSISATSLAAGHRVELGLEGATLNEGLGNWKGAHSKGEFTLGASDRLGVESVFASRFEESGLLLGASLTHEYNEDSYQVFGLHGTTHGLFWPSSGVNTQYYRKLGAERSWIVGAGVGYLRSRAGNSDLNGLLEAIAYLSEHWVLEGGARGNLSNPGSIFSKRGFLAVTLLLPPRVELVAIVDAGDEAYQAIAPGDVQVSRFKSISLTLESTVRVGALDSGRSIRLRGERYGNEFYSRWGGYLGVVQEF